MAKFKTYYERCADLGIGMPPLIWSKSGVYALVCTQTGKMYIGCSNNIMSRLKAHTDSLKRGTHVNKYLQSAWNKHGIDNFHATVIQYIDEKFIYEEEKRWIAEFNSQLEGFNLTAGGDGIWFLDEEIKKKARVKITAALRTKEVTKKISAWSKRFHAENKDKMKEVLRQNALSRWEKISKEERTKLALHIWEKRRAKKNE